MTQPKFTILCAPPSLGGQSPSWYSTGQPRSSMEPSFRRGDTAIAAFLLHFWKLCWSLNLREIYSYAEIRAAAHVCCLCEKGYHYMPSFGSRGLGHQEGGSRCLDGLVNHVPSGQSKIYVLLDGIQPTRIVRQSSIKRSCWPALFVHTNWTTGGHHQY